MSWLDHDNLRAVLWSASYCASLVLVAGAFSALGLTPTVTVPVVVVVLPFLVGAAFSIAGRSRSETTHD